MARLNKVQKCYIEVNAGSLSTKVIAKDLGIEEKVVQKHINKYVPDEAETVEVKAVEVVSEPEQKEEAPTNITPAHGFDKLGLFARRKDRGVLAMTAAGSSAGDESRAKVPSLPPMREGVRKIREDQD